jgi:integrase
MTGTIIRIKGLNRFRHAVTGTQYIYHRASGKRIKAPFGSPEFFVELAAVEREMQALKDEAAKPGTLRALILSYRDSDAFRDLAPRTKLDYERVFAFLEPLHHLHVSLFTTPAICQLRDEWRKERGRRFIDYVRTVLVLIFARGVELGVLTHNPAKAVGKIGRDRRAPPVNRAWTDAERSAVWAAVNTERWRHLRLPIALGIETGMREGDVIALTRSAIKGGLLSIKTSKRGVDVVIPVSPLLAEALRDAESHNAVTLCVNSLGLPWRGNGFRSGLQKMMRALEAEGKIGRGCTFHGLRHDVATRLAEAGCSAEDIAAVLGQKSSRIAAHYADKADRSRRTRAAITKLKPLKAAKE